MTQRDEGHDYRDSKNKAEAFERKKQILIKFQEWLEKCPIDYDEHYQTSDDDITTINFHSHNIFNRNSE